MSSVQGCIHEDSSAIGPEVRSWEIQRTQDLKDILLCALRTVPTKSAMSWSLSLSALLVPSGNQPVPSSSSMMLETWVGSEALWDVIQSPSRHSLGPNFVLLDFGRREEGGMVVRTGARPIKVPGVNAALLARPESQIITSISNNGRVINTGLVSPTPPGLRRLIQADGRALKDVMDNSLNSPNAAQPGREG